MGQDNPAVKPLLLAFGEGAVFKKLPDNVSIPVWLFDHTSHSKFMPMRFDVNANAKVPAKTGYEFLMECFLKKPLNAFNKKAVIVYVCLDRGSPVNKSIEHETRYANVEPMATPVDYFDSPALLNDYRMPNVKTNDEWKTFIGNPQLFRRMVHYMTMRMIGTRGDIDEELRKYVCALSNDDYDDDLQDLTIDYRHDKTLFLHGGRLRKPDPDRPRFYQHPDPFLLEFKTVTTEVPPSSVPSRHASGGRYDIKRSVKINRAYDSNVINNVLEGEVAALFYAQAHMERGDNVMIVTPDMDVLMMLLLSCPDRINPATGKFVCRVFVQLAVSTPGCTRYVDVHQLWYNIHSTRPLKRMGSPGAAFSYKSRTSNEYVSKICAMCLLCGTDYVKNYCLGITNKKGTFDEAILDALIDKEYIVGSGQQVNKPLAVMRKNLEELPMVPWIVYTFLKHYDEFENMITITRSPEYDVTTKIRSCAKVDIDEAAFIHFTRCVYVEHYTTSLVHKKQFESKYGDDASLANVKAYLYEDKLEKLNDKLAAQKRQEERLRKPNAKIPKKLIAVNVTKSMATIKRNRLPPPRKIRVSCRHLLWQLEYMLNSYKFGCSVVDPTTLYLELPYYGWFLSSGKCKVAARVSLKRPNVEEFKKRHVIKRRFVASRAAALSASLLGNNGIESTYMDIDNATMATT